MSTGAVHGFPEASYVASEAMATNYTAVKLGSSANQVSIATAVSDVVVGITQTTASASGLAVTVVSHGNTLARSSGGWTKGDALTATTGGALLTTTTASDKVCARALETVATGEQGEVFVFPPVRYDSL